MSSGSEVVWGDDSPSCRSRRPMRRGLGADFLASGMGQENFNAVAKKNYGGKKRKKKNRKVESPVAKTSISHSDVVGEPKTPVQRIVALSRSGVLTRSQERRRSVLQNIELCLRSNDMPFGQSQSPNQSSSANQRSATSSASVSSPNQLQYSDDSLLASESLLASSEALLEEGEDPFGSALQSPGFSQTPLNRIPGRRDFAAQPSPRFAASTPVIGQRKRRYARPGVSPMLQHAAVTSPLALRNSKPRSPPRSADDSSTDDLLANMSLPGILSPQGRDN